MRRSAQRFFQKIGAGYRNPTPLSEFSSPLVPAGRGHAGTAAFFNNAMTENVKRVEEALRKAALDGRRGYELEAEEMTAKNTGENQANH